MVNFLDDAVNWRDRAGTEAEQMWNNSCFCLLSVVDQSSLVQVPINFLLKEPNTATGREGFE